MQGTDLRTRLEGIRSFFWIRVIFLAFIMLSTASVQALEHKISGVVVDESGKGIIGAKVLLEKLPRRYQSALQELQDDRLSEPIAVAETDKNGRYSITTEFLGAARLVVVPKNSISYSQSIVPLLQSVELKTLTVYPEKTLKVTVKDFRGSPIPGALVRAEVKGLWRIERSLFVADQSGQVQISVPYKGARISGWHQGFLSVSAKSQGGELVLNLKKGFRRRIKMGSTGVFDLSQSVLVVDGKWPLGVGDLAEPMVLAVPAAGSLPLEFLTHGGFRFVHELGRAKAESSEDFTWPIPPVMSFTGYVVDGRSGRPIYDAVVWPVGAPESFKLTNKKGGFFMGRPLRPFEIRIEANGYRSKGVTFEGTTEEAHERKRVIALEPDGFLEGVVVDPQGKGIEGARIRPVDSNKSFSKPEGRAGSDGTFKVGPTGAQAAIIESEGLAASFWRSNDQTSKVVLKKGGSVTGRVLDAKGEPLNTAEVGVWLLNEEGTRLTAPPLQAIKVEKDGHFRFPNLPLSFLGFEIKAKGYVNEKESVSLRGVKAGEEKHLGPINLREPTEEEKAKISM